MLSDGRSPEVQNLEYMGLVNRLIAGSVMWQCSRGYCRSHRMH